LISAIQFQEGQSQPKIPAVKRALTKPSNMDLKVVSHDRLYQIECGIRAREYRAKDKAGPMKMFA
jgi:hypothetical protein